MPESHDLHDSLHFIPNVLRDFDVELQLNQWVAIVADLVGNPNPDLTKMVVPIPIAIHAIEDRSLQIVPRRHMIWRQSEVNG